MSEEDTGTPTARRVRSVPHRTVAVPREGGPRAAGRQRRTVPVARRRSGRARGVFTAGAATAAWAGLSAFIPILVLVIAAWWAAGRESNVSTVVRAAGATWLAGHGVPVDIAGLPLSLTPLLITALIVWRLMRAGAYTIRAIGGQDTPAVRAATIVVTGSYTLLAVLTAYLSDEAPFAMSVPRSAVHAAVLSAVAACLGALAESGSGHALWHRLPVWQRRGIRTGLLATLSLLAVGALVAGAGLAARGGLAADTLREYPGGELAVGLLALVYLPTVAVWGSAYVLGPGFAVGTDTTVTVADVDVGAMPVFPWFAAVPTEPLGDVGTALLGLPPAIGVGLGVLLAMRSRDLRVSQLIGACVVAGMVSGAVQALTAGAASGGLGHARLAELGPPVWSVAGVMLVSVLISVLVSSLVTRVVVHRIG